MAPVSPNEHDSCPFGPVCSVKPTPINPAFAKPAFVKPTPINPAVVGLNAYKSTNESDGSNGQSDGFNGQSDGSNGQSGGSNGQSDSSNGQPVVATTEGVIVTTTLAPSSASVASSATIGAYTTSSSTSLPLSSALPASISEALPSSPSQYSTGTTTSLPTGMRKPLPLGYIVAIIMGCLFFITLCLVIYVRRPRFPIFGPFSTKKYPPAPPTISSFEPKEYLGSIFYSRAQSLHSMVTLPTFRLATSDNSTSAPSRSRPTNEIMAPSPFSYEDFLPASSRYPCARASISSWRSFPWLSRPSSGMKVSRIQSLSVLDEYPFEHDAPAPLSPKSVDWPPTVKTSASFPQSVHDVTVE
ncbi:hypothetical protein BDZ97DRAFT_1853329 [Flammula alnicola]|nr:hypothetical protein BDZ97DRAFT_1853329 [Flammula alnicola]